MKMVSLAASLQAQPWLLVFEVISHPYFSIATATIEKKVEDYLS